MPRLPRIYIDGAVYLITCRGAHHEKIFREERDYLMFMELLKKYQEQYSVKIFSFVLLPDHIHLLVDMAKTREDGNKAQEISSFMHDLNNSYTKGFNSAYQRKGHLFRERFKAALVEKDENYLLKMTAYIHLNPQKLNLIPDAKEYPFSSFKYYLNERETPNSTIDLREAIGEVLGFLENRDYAAFVNGLTEEDSQEIHKKLQRGGIIGSDEFIKRVKEEIENYQKESQAEEKPAASSYRLFVITASVVLLVVLSAAGTFFYFRNKSKAKESLKGSGAVNENVTALLSRKAEDMNAAEWQIQLVPNNGGKEILDTITFRQGKFNSVMMSLMKFPTVNYSLTVEDTGRIVWETMQSGPEGTASWRGEFDNGKLSGILSLRQNGNAPQDFSFVGISHRRME